MWSTKSTNWFLDNHGVDVTSCSSGVCAIDCGICVGGVSATWNMTCKVPGSIFLTWIGLGEIS